MTGGGLHCRIGGTLLLSWSQARQGMLPLRCMCLMWCQGGSSAARPCYRGVYQALGVIRELTSGWQAIIGSSGPSSAAGDEEQWVVA